MKKYIFHIGLDYGFELDESRVSAIAHSPQEAAEQIRRSYFGLRELQFIKAVSL